MLWGSIDIMCLFKLFLFLLDDDIINIWVSCMCDQHVVTMIFKIDWQLSTWLHMIKFLISMCTDNKLTAISVYMRACVCLSPKSKLYLFMHDTWQEASNCSDRYWLMWLTHSSCNNTLFSDFSPLIINQRTSI